MKNRSHIIVIPQRNTNGDAHDKSVQFPILSLDSVVKPSLTLCKMRDLFRKTTGLDLFLFFKNQSMGRWKEEPFSGEIQLPHYCRMIRGNTIGLARCISSHQSMQKKALECNRPVCQRCHAGLTSVHFPVSIIDKGNADLQTVCALSHGERADKNGSLLDKISDLELPDKMIKKSLDELQILSKYKERRIIDWLELLADYLAESSRQKQLDASAEALRPAVEAQDCPSIEQRIRQKIGRSITLPSWRAQRSTGVSAALIELTTAFIDQHFGMSLSTQVISQALGFEPSYYARIFREFERESLTSYLKRVRLNRAQKLLNDPYLSILEIAQRTGFADASYFTRVFRNSFGITPTQYRNISNLSAE